MVHHLPSRVLLLGSHRCPIAWTHIRSLKLSCLVLVTGYPSVAPQCAVIKNTYIKVITLI